MKKPGQPVHTSRILLMSLLLLGSSRAIGQGVGSQAAAVPPAETIATGIIDTGTVHQEIAGFGASEAFFQDYLARHPHRGEIYDALFGPENGLHIDYLRLRNMFAYQDKPGFDQDTVDILKAAAKLRGKPLTLMMSSWSPPASLKSNGSEKNGGTLVQKNGQYDYAGYAQYWKDSLAAYRAVGIDPAYVSIQNEPDQTVAYESCRFNPTEAPYRGETYAGYDKALDAVYKAFQQMASPPRLVGPDVIGIGYGKLLAFTQAADAKELYALCHHYYTGGDKKQPDTYIPLMRSTREAFPKSLLFQTEYFTPAGFETVLMIEDSLVAEEVNLYLYWPLTWPSATGTLLMIEDPADPSKWKTAQGWGFTDGYYALKQFSYFIGPGYHRVEATSDAAEVKLSAYLSPKHDKLVAVAINTSNTAEKVIALKLGEFDRGKSRIYRTTFPDTQDRFTALGAMGPDHRLMLPPHSVATVEISR